MSTHSDIINALNKRLSQCVGIPTIQWQNTANNDDISQDQIRQTLIPSATNRATVDGGMAFSGVYQIDLFCRLNKGIKIMNDYVDNIIDHFLAIKTLTNNSTTIYILTASPGPQFRDENCWKGSVDITYSCYTN